MIGAVFGVDAYDAAEGVPVEVQLVGVFDLPAVSPTLQGAAVYRDLAAGNITAADSGTVLVGTALIAVGVSGTTCRTRLNGVAVVAA